MMNARGWIVLALVVVASAVAGWTEWTAANVASDTRSAGEIRRDMERGK